jgi:hypothetical protein
MTLPDTATATVGVLAAMTFSASGAAPTQLHEQYQANLGQTCACKARLVCWADCGKDMKKEILLLTKRPSW